MTRSGLNTIHAVGQTQWDIPKGGSLGRNKKQRDVRDMIGKVGLATGR